MNALNVELSGAGLDDCVVITAEVREGVSSPTEAEVQAIAPSELDGASALKEPVALVVNVDGEPVRKFHLVVTGVTLRGLYDFGDGRAGFRYELSLAHELSLLTHRADVRMFQDEKVDEIVNEVLEGAGLDVGRYAFRLTRDLSPRVYCVQYRESDFAFTSRLLEHEGIFYVVEHGDDEAIVAFEDDSTALGAIDGDSRVRFMEQARRGAGIHTFWLETVDGPDKVSLSDYAFESPNLDLTCDTEMSDGGLDWFEYPGGYQDKDEGSALVEIRGQELVAARIRGHGESHHMRLRAGATFELDIADHPSLGRSYLLLSVEHRFVLRPQDAPGRGDDPPYVNRFTCLPQEVRYRPPRVTPVPRARGGHTVVVTGPSGSEIHTDEYGRMKAKFFWDRVGAADDTSSTWMRLTQLPIGGSMALARMGWEMAVVHALGDPDRPTAIARMYNAEKASPYGYPAAASKMAIQTPTSPGGGGSNEIRLSDGAGGQELFINATKDFNGVTNNNTTVDIGVDDSRSVGVDASLQVGANQTFDIGASLTETVGSDEGVSIAVDRSKSVGGSETVTVSDNVTNVITGSDTETTGGSHTSLAGLGIDRTAIGSYSLTVGGSRISAAAAEASFAVAGAKAETVGGVKISAAGSSFNHSCIGAMAITVGGVCLQAAGANYSGSTSGSSALTVGGVACVNAAGNISMKAPKISIKVAGVANLLGGGGILTLTAGSASFVGLVKLDASSKLTIKGNPNFVG